MRKQLTTLILGAICLLAFSPDAQAQWTEEKLQGIYIDFLKGEGLEGTIDSDGDVQFTYDEHTFFFEVNETDNEFFRLVLPNVWAIESISEGLEAVQACDEVNRSMKCAKAYVTNDNVWIAVELFVNQPSDFEAVFDRCIEAVEDGLEKFIAKMQ